MAYDDCRTIFEKAMADPKGARAKTGTYDAAMQLRTRMNYFRTLDRRSNAEIYPADNPMHGQSLYDTYVCQIERDEDGEFWLYVVPRMAKVLALEGISDGGDLIDINPTDVEAHEVHMIEDKTNG